MSQPVVIVILFLSRSYELDSKDVFETHRSACPYNDFCTVGSLMELTPSKDKQPCCLDCFCDRFPVAFGDSCPDYVRNETFTPVNISKEKLGCKPVFFENSYTLGGNNTVHAEPTLGISHLRYIDFCPVDYDEDSYTEDRCTGNYDTKPTYDDIVAVSDKDGALFKNKHCARCHGEINFNRWNLKVLRCKDRLEDLQLSVSEMENYILKYCLITSSRPDELAMNSRALECRDKLICDVNLAYPKLTEYCLNGPRMPYIYQKELGLYSIYRNIFCANCRNNVHQICPKVDQTEGRSFIPSLQVLLRMTHVQEGIRNIVFGQ